METRKVRYTRAERIEQVKELRDEGFTLEQMVEVMGITQASTRQYLYEASDNDVLTEQVKEKIKKNHLCAIGLDFEWQWPLVCNRVLGRTVHEVPNHSKSAEIKFWKS